MNWVPSSPTLCGALPLRYSSPRSRSLHGFFLRGAVWVVRSPVEAGEYITLHQQFAIDKSFVCYRRKLSPGPRFMERSTFDKLT